MIVPVKASLLMALGLKVEMALELKLGMALELKLETGPELELNELAGAPGGIGASTTGTAMTGAGIETLLLPLPPALLQGPPLHFW